MRPRPANHWAKQSPYQPIPAQNMRQIAEEKPTQKEEEPSEEKIAMPDGEMQPYRLSIAIADQQVMPGDALKWGRSSMHLTSGDNLLLLNITFVTETASQAHWTLYAGEQKVADLSCQCQAYQPATLMLHTYLPSESEKDLTLKNTAENVLIIQQGSLNVLALDK